MKTTQIINLDPIDRKKKQQKSFFGRLLITRVYRGRSSAPQEPFGHYMFCGEQRSGKSISIIWFMEQKIKKYRKKKLTYIEPETNMAKKFKVPPKIYVYSNMGFAKPVTRDDLYSTIVNFDEYENAVRFVLIDEMQVYFKRDTRDKKTLEAADQLSDLFCQLGKRNTYILSTSQVYGRVEKSLREQCLYMVDCKKSRTGKFINEMILKSDILCDDLGRWSGNPTRIFKHGLPKIKYDTKKIIKV